MTQDEEIKALHDAVLQLSVCVTQINGTLMHLVYGAQFGLGNTHSVDVRAEFDHLQIGIKGLIKSLEVLENNKDSNEY